jgi:putative addiction module CopG family antidote
MNVSLPRELDQYIRNGVASGRYTSASEVVREALRLLQQIERSRDMGQALGDARLHELEMEVFGRPLRKDSEHGCPTRRRNPRHR